MLPFDSSVLRSIVEKINLYHMELSKKWLAFNTHDNLNLKTTRTDHLVHKDEMLIDPKFLGTVGDFHQFLYKETAAIAFEFEYSEFDVRTRIKQKDSIINKLIHYRHNESIKGGGKVPINKCLNDIYGIRIVFENLNHDDEQFNNIVNDLTNQLNLRKVNKRNKEYKATHLYFKNGTNYYFPWELQIWSSLDVKRNEISHEEHADKRKYAEWPDVYRNSLQLERRDL